MKQKIYNIVTGIIFFIVAAFHLARIVFSWQVLFGSLVIPFWVSWIGFVIAGVLAYLGLKLSKQAQ